MMNFKRSRKSMIVLSLIVALFLCSIATVYAFAANDYKPENSKADIKEDENINLVMMLEKIKNNERFCNELEAMYDQLISNQEFTGTIEDFYNEAAGGMAVLENFKNNLGDDVNLEELREQLENAITNASAKSEDFNKSFGCDINSEELREQLENLIAKNFTKFEDLKKKIAEKEMFMAELVDREIAISELEQKLRDKYDPRGTINFMIPIMGNMIRLLNGVIIEAPEYTVIKIVFIENSGIEIEITIGKGDAEVTKADGTSTTVPEGTVLDGEGYVIRENK